MLKRKSFKRGSEVVVKFHGKIISVNDDSVRITVNSVNGTRRRPAFWAVVPKDSVWVTEFEES